MALSAGFFYIYVACTGAAVMAIELAASRFLAPYFGTSMIVWANVIGLVLLAMSIGYWVGGRLADKRPSVRILLSITTAAGLWTASLPLWGHWIFAPLSNGLLDTSISVILLSFAAILMVFAPPVFLLAMVSPYAIRLTTSQTASAGSVAGNLYACSTVGSLVGTFCTAFVTVPQFGLTDTFIIWSSLLIGVSVWGWLRHWAIQLATASTLLLLIGGDTVVARQAGPTPTGKDVLWAKDTLYQHVQVDRNKDGSVELVYNEGGGVQSVRRPHDALTETDYYDDYLLLPYLVSASKHLPSAATPIEVAVLGLAGGTIPHLLAKYDAADFLRLHVTGVEIDPDVIPLDTHYFGLQPTEATLVNADGRVYIRQSKKSFDLIIVDAYANQIYIPPHMSTREFFEEVAHHLTPDGLLALNVNATSEDAPLLLAFERTLTNVYPYVYRIKAQGAFNQLLIGSQKALPTSPAAHLPAAGPLAQVVRHWPTVLKPLQASDVRKGMLLTDDKAPTESLTDRMIVQYAKHR